MEVDIIHYFACDNEYVSRPKSTALKDIQYPLTWLTIIIQCYDTVGWVV